MLYTSDYDDYPLGNIISPPWEGSHIPAAPGSTDDGGTLQWTRQEIVGSAPGSPADPYRPSGKCLRIELRPYSATNPGTSEPRDGDVTKTGSSSGYTNRMETRARLAANANSTPPEDWPDPVGSIRWYGWSVYVPSDHVFGSNLQWFTSTQWKGQFGGSPPLAIEIQGSNWRLGAVLSSTVLGPVTRGAWARWVVGIRWSADATQGWVHIFKDGVEILPLRTQKTMEGSPGSEDPTYFKQGIYRTAGWAVTHILHFGPAKIGHTRDDVWS